MRDDNDFRIPGTQRQYGLTEEYSRCTGYYQNEYVGEIRRRKLFRKLRSVS